MVMQIGYVLFVFLLVTGSIEPFDDSSKICLDYVPRSCHQSCTAGYEMEPLNCSFIFFLLEEGLAYFHKQLSFVTNLCVSMSSIDLQSFRLRA